MDLSSRCFFVLMGDPTALRQAQGADMTDLPPLQAQPSAVPTRKTSAVMIGGGASTALSVVLGWLLDRMGLEVPAEVQVAAVSLVLAATAYLTREREPT